MLLLRLSASRPQSAIAAAAPPLWFGAAIVGCLIVATFAAWLWTPEALETGQVLYDQQAILDGAYPAYDTRLDEVLTDDGVRIENSVQDGSAGVRFRLPVLEEPVAPFLRLTAEVRADDIESSGAAEWKSARLFLARYGGSVKSRHGEIAYAAALKTGAGWRRVSTVMPVLEPGQRGFLGLEL